MFDLSISSTITTKNNVVTCQSINTNGINRLKLDNLPKQKAKITLKIKKYILKQGNQRHKKDNY